MGLKCGNSINYSINDIDFKSLMTIAKFRTTRRTALNGDTTPVIDIDASWVIRRFSSSPLVMQINYLMSMCVLFISEGCRVVIICAPKIIHEFMFQPKTNITLFDDMLDMFLNQ